MVILGDDDTRNRNAFWKPLLKTVPRLKVAAVHLGLIRIHSGVATRPTQKQLGAERKDNHLPIQFRLNAYAFGSRGQSEVQAFSKDDWIRFMNNLADHRVDYFRFQQKRRGVGPVEGRDHKRLISLRETI